MSLASKLLIIILALIPLRTFAQEQEQYLVDGFDLRVGYDGSYNVRPGNPNYVGNGWADLGNGSQAVRFKSPDSYLLNAFEFVVRNHKVTSYMSTAGLNLRNGTPTVAHSTIVSATGASTCDITVGQKSECQTYTASDCAKFKKAMDSFAKELGGKHQAEACRAAMEELTNDQININKYSFRAPADHEAMLKNKFHIKYNSTKIPVLNSTAQIHDTEKLCQRVARFGSGGGNSHGTSGNSHDGGVRQLPAGGNGPAAQ